MTTLTAWCYHDLDGAMRAERELAALSDQELVTVDDASLVFWPRTAVVPQTRGAGNVVHTRPLGSTFWGLFYGLAFAAPLLESGDVKPRYLQEVGVDAVLVTRMRAGLRPGTSGLLTVTDRPVNPDVAEQLATCGPAATSFDLSLSGEHSANLRRVFGGDWR